MPAAARLLVALALLAGLARAHVPHDVINHVRVSPDYAADGRLFALALLTDHTLLLESDDQGRSWIARGIAPLAAGVTDLAFSPDFASDQTLFLTTASEGLWRSLDGGASWHALGAALPATQLADVALSPDFANDGFVVVVGEAGVHVSHDGGDSWAPADAGLADTVLTRVLVAPDDPAVLLAAGDVLHRSDDGGASWTPLQTLPFEVATLAVAADFTSSGLALAGFGRSGGGLWASTDGGASFAPVANGPRDPEVNAVAVASDGTLFAVTDGDGCHVADSLAGPWVASSAGLEPQSPQTGDHYRSLALSPQFATDRELWMGGFEGLFRSQDGGASWWQADTYNQRFCRRLVVSPDFAEDGRLFASNYGGGAWLHRGAFEPGAVAPSAPGRTAGAGAGLPGVPLAPGGGPAAPGAPLSTPDVGPLLRAWDERARGVNILYDGVIAASPDFAQDRTLFYGFVGLWRSQDAGRSWEPLPDPIVIARDITLSPDFARAPVLFVGTSGNGTFVSHDAGDSFAELAGGLPPGLRTSEIRLAPDFPADPRVWLASFDAGLWRSPDAGASWTPLPLPASSSDVRAFAVAPDGATLLAGTAGGGLWRSTDGGDSWSAAWSGLPSAQAGTIESLAFSPDFASDATAWVADLVDGVFRSTDGGASWSPAGAGLPPAAPRAVALSPGYASDHTLFVSTYDWIWRSTDDGASWEPLPAYTRVDERHDAVQRSGAWTAVNGGAHFGPGVERSSDPGATRALAFHGRSIAWHAVRSPFSGRAEVRVDGGPPQLVDLHAPAEEPSAPVFVRRFPAADWHTIEVTVTGTSHPLALGIEISTDGFEYDG